METTSASIHPIHIPSHHHPPRSIDQTFNLDRRLSQTRTFALSKPCDIANRSTAVPSFLGQATVEPVPTSALSSPPPDP